MNDFAFDDDGWIIWLIVCAVAGYRWGQLYQDLCKLLPNSTGFLYSCKRSKDSPCTLSLQLYMYRKALKLTRPWKSPRSLYGRPSKL
jgi:hypothetical protein